MAHKLPKKEYMPMIADIPYDFRMAGSSYNDEPLLSGQAQLDPNQRNKPEPDQSSERRTGSVSGWYLEPGAGSDCNQ